MGRSSRGDRVLCPFRLHKSDLVKAKAKVVQDGTNFQRMVEVLVTSYLKNNKEINRLVQAAAQEAHVKHRRNSINEYEANDILEMIEKEYSPLRHFDEAIKEIKQEEEEDDE